MSLYHYIGSNIPLPTGEFGGIKSPMDRSGSAPPKATYFVKNDQAAVRYPFDPPYSIREDEIEVYETMEDAASIFIIPLADCRPSTVRKHFRQPYVYGLAPAWGQFRLNPDMRELFPEEYKACAKCVATLFDFMRNAGDDRTVFEIYSCWYDEEAEESDPALASQIRLSAFRAEDGFELKDRQYLSIVK